MLRFHTSLPMLCIPAFQKKPHSKKLVLRLFSFWDFFEKSLMAISVTNAAVPLLNINRSTSSSSSSFSKLCVSNSLRFPQQLRSFQMGNRSLSSLPQRRNLVRIEAKKQTFSSFDDLLATAEKPVLVDFYATWCGPCQFMVSVLNEVSVSLNDKIQLVKIDTEKYPQIADQYSIQALPTFIIFRDGKPCDRFEGALTAQQLIQRIETALA